MELSILCGCKVQMIIYDQYETRMIQYMSDLKDNFSTLQRKSNSKELYTNKDYHKLSNKKDSDEHLIEEDSQDESSGQKLKVTGERQLFMIENAIMPPPKEVKKQSPMAEEYKNISVAETQCITPSPIQVKSKQKLIDEQRESI
mmetsp:Transcript_15213/g.11062  ORF Transcript_15213/g.11062 Transcript_15213/m.11062 type:complete len:144 (+) Transcript_15213:100-531(+)